MRIVIGAVTFLIMLTIDNIGRILAYGFVATLGLAIALPAFS